jgi:hypothetical protein
MLNVVCLKHGTKYSSEYVNKLYNMIQRHLTVPHRFTCFTENKENLNDNINVIDLPNIPLEGWWFKPYIFRRGHFPDGDTVLYFDLDMVIINNIDHFISYLPENFVGLQDVGRVFRPGYQKLGSAVMRWPANKYFDIWEKLESNWNLARKHHGDQDWIWSVYAGEIKFFPESWILSYKWEVRSRTELAGLGRNSFFKAVRDPEIPNGCAVLAFHGNPPVHAVQDPVIVANWR